MKYTYELKVKIVNEFENGESLGKLSRKYEVPKGTISNWIYKARKNISLEGDNRGRPKGRIDYKERYEILKKFQTFLEEVDQEKK